MLLNISSSPSVGPRMWIAAKPFTHHPKRHPDAIGHFATIHMWGPTDGDDEMFSNISALLSYSDSERRANDKKTVVCVFIRWNSTADSYTAKLILHASFGHHNFSGRFWTDISDIASANSAIGTSLRSTGAARGARRHSMIFFKMIYGRYSDRLCLWKSYAHYYHESIMQESLTGENWARLNTTLHNALWQQ